MGKTINGQLLEQDMMDILGYLVAEKYCGAVRVNVTPKALRDVISKFELHPSFGENVVSAQWKQMLIMSGYDKDWHRLREEFENLDSK